MYDQYGLGVPTPATRRMQNYLLYGTGAERRAGETAQRPLGVLVAEHAQPVAHEVALGSLPTDAADHLGFAVAARAIEVVTQGMEG